MRDARPQERRRRRADQRRVVWTLLVLGVPSLALAHTVVLKAGRRPAGEPPRSELVAAALKKKVSLDFVETPLQDVLSFISSQVDVTFILDAEAVPDHASSVTLKVTDMALDHALSWLCVPIGLVYAERDGAIAITSRARLDKTFPPKRLGRWFVSPPEDAASVQKKLAARISFDFVETPLQDVASFLSSLTGVRLDVDPGLVLGEHPSLTLKVAQMRFDHVLLWVCRLTGTVFAWRDGGFYITTPVCIEELARAERALRDLERRTGKPIAKRMAKIIQVRIEKETFKAAVSRLLRKHLEVPFAIDTSLVGPEPRRIWLRIERASLGAVLRALCRQAHMGYAWLKGGLFIGPTDRVARLLERPRAARPGCQRPPSARAAAFMAQPLTRDLAGLSFGRALKLVARTRGQDVVLHAELAGGKDPTVWLAVHGVPREQVLRWLCHLHDADYIWRRDHILVAPRERMRDRLWREFHRPPTPRLDALASRRLGLELAERGLDDTLDYLSRFTGVRFVLHPAAVAGRMPAVSLSALDQRFDAAVWELCESAGLACVWWQGGVVVSTREHVTAALMVREQRRHVAHARRPCGPRSRVTHAATP